MKWNDTPVERDRNLQSKRIFLRANKFLTLVSSQYCTIDGMHNYVRKPEARGEFWS